MRAVKTRELSDAMLLKYKEQIDAEVKRRWPPKKTSLQPILELGPGDWGLPPKLKKHFHEKL